MATSYGIYVTDGRAYVAQVKGSRRSFEVVSLHDEIVGNGDPVQALAGLLDRAGALGRRVHVALDGRMAFVRVARLPLTNARQIEKTAGFEVENLSPAVPLENLAVAHHIVGRDSEGSDVLLLAVEKGQVERLAALLSEGGAQPAGITLDSVALFNLAAAQGHVGEGPGAVVACGDEAVRIVLTRKGEMRLVRSLGVPAAGAEDLGERVVEELRRSLAVADQGESLETIVLAGAGTGDLFSRMEGAFQARVAVCDPLSKLDRFRDEPPPPAGVFAVGAALKGLAAETVDVDFALSTAPPATAYGVLRDRLLYTAVVAFLLFAILAVKASIEASREEEVLDTIRRKEKVLFSRVAKELGLKKKYRPQSWDKTAESAVKKALKRDDPQETAYTSFLDRWQLVARALDGAGATVVNIAFDQQKVVVSGLIPDIDKFDQMVLSFRRVFGEGVQDKFERRGKRDKRRSTFTIEIPNR